jgi:hypothetical protein
MNNPVPPESKAVDEFQPPPLLAIGQPAASSAGGSVYQPRRCSMTNKDRVIREFEGSIAYYNYFLKQVRLIDDEEAFGRILKATTWANHYLAEWCTSSITELEGRIPLEMLKSPEQRAVLMRFLDKLIAEK